MDVINIVAQKKVPIAKDKYIELVVAFSILYITTFKICSLIIGIFFPFMRIMDTILKWIPLLLMLHYQIQKYGIKFKSTAFLYFIIIYSVYILTDITILRAYPLDQMLAVPKSLGGYCIYTFQLFAYLMCAQTIIRYFNIRYFIYLSTIFCLIPTLWYINFVGVDFLQIYANADDKLMIAHLTLAYTNIPIIVLAIINYNNLSSKKWMSFLFVAVLVLGIGYILVVSTKRGPILWTFVSVFICFYYKTQNSFKYLVYTFIALAIFYFSIDVILSFIGQYAPKSAERLYATIYEGDTAHRFDMSDKGNSGYLLGMEQFLSSPIWGSYFRITGNNLFKGCYPHNIFIEILMTMGLLGFIPFIIFLKRAFFNIHKTFKNNYSPKQMSCFILFIVSLLQLMTTGTIVQNIHFWLFFYIILTINKYQVSYKQ